MIDAATVTLAERGYEGATFRQIAAGIGMTRGAVHHHFPGGKDELVAAVLTEQWTRYGTNVLAPLRATGRTPAERIEAFLVGYVERLTGDPLFRALATVTNLVASATASAGDPFDERRQALAGWRAALHEVIAPPARLRPGVTPETAVFLLVTVVQGVNDTAAFEPDRLPRTDQERRSIARVVVGGLFDDPGVETLAPV